MNIFLKVNHSINSQGLLICGWHYRFRARKRVVFGEKIWEKTCSHISGQARSSHLRPPFGPRSSCWGGMVRNSKMVLLYPYSPKKYGKAHLSQGFTRFHYNRCGRFFSHPQSSVGGFPPGTGLCAILEPRPSQGPGAGRKMGKIYREKDDRPDMFHELHTRWAPQLQVGL